jgi:hypothetical protein
LSAQIAAGLAVKCWRALAFVIGYVLLFALVYFLHSRYLRVDVVLYSAVLDALVAAALSYAVLHLAGALAAFNGFERLQLLSCWLLLGYVLAISLPAVIDRSLSFYILEKIQQRGGAVPEREFAAIFTRDYLTDHQLVAVRLTEQQSSGTITIESGCVRLTPRGQRFANFSRFFRRELLPRHRLLRGEYSDRLARPFPPHPYHADPTCH